jgi:hypothetical protein
LGSTTTHGSSGPGSTTGEGGPEEKKEEGEKGNGS